MYRHVHAITWAITLRLPTDTVCWREGCFLDSSYLTSCTCIVTDTTHYLFLLSTSELWLKSSSTTHYSAEMATGSRGGDPFGLASEAALQGWRPLRPRKRGSAPGVATPSASQARQRSRGGDPFRPRKRGSAPREATPSQLRFSQDRNRISKIPTATVPAVSIVGQTREVVLGPER